LIIKCNFFLREGEIASMNLIYKAAKDKDHPYVMILRDTLYDRDLSLKAKGLLVFILSKPDDWQIYVDALAKELKESKNTVGAIINELRDRGYCIRTRRTGSGGRLDGYNYMIFENLKDREDWENRLGKKLFPELGGVLPSKLREQEEG
jgi:predicted transcriptional regulator